MTTDKQRLRAHIEAEHGGFGVRQGDRFRGYPLLSWTLQQLGTWHARQHHRLSTSHYHAGPNTGPGDRPRGWWTGADARPKT